MGAQHVLDVVTLNARKEEALKLQSLLREVSESKKVKLIFTNFNDRSQDKVWRLSAYKLDRIVDVHDLLAFTERRHPDETVVAASAAVSESIKTGQAVPDENLWGMHFAIDIRFSDTARGVSFIIEDTGIVKFKVRVDEKDQAGVINFDDNFTEYKAYVKTSLE